MKKLYFLTVVLTLILAVSCSVNPIANGNMETSISLNENLSSSAAGDVMVQLLKAKIVSSYHPAPYTATVTLTGEIEVKNIAFNKSVTVHVNSVGSSLLDGINTDWWYDVAAEYSRPSEKPGYEIWSFSVPTALYKGGQGIMPLFEYVIKYDVNGGTYWDNHYGNNYKDAFVKVAEVKLKEASYYTTSHPALYTMVHNLTGTIEVENISYQKNVIVHYLGKDNNWHQVYATYAEPSENAGNEYWEFAIAEDVYMYPPDDFFRFAIEYVSDAGTFWDNNNGHDYHINEL